MSFLYPQTITISRPTGQSQIGATGYAGEVAGTETVILSGVPASIQAKKEVNAPLAGLPTDAARRGFWNVLFRAPLGALKDRDIITDDQGIRYQVTAAYWTPLGYSALCERLEA
ncbi:MAG: hypothetical protein ACP5RV_12445 [Thiomonas sp.]